MGIFANDKEKYHFLEDLSRSINEAQSLQEAMYELLSLLKRIGEWQIALLWKVQPKANIIACIEVVTDPEGLLQEFEKKSRTFHASYQENALPFQVWKEKKTIVAHALAPDSRSEAAQKEGIGSGFAVPLFQNADLLYVLEIYKKGALNQTEEEEFQALLSFICLQWEIFLKYIVINERRDKQQAVLNFLVDAVYSCDLEGNITSWNKGAELIYKWTEEEILGKSIATFIPEKEKEYFEYLLQHFAKGEQLIHVETEAVSKQGEVFVVHTTYTMIRDAQNKLIGVAITAHDATCQKRANEALQKSEEKFRHFIETTQDWIWEVDDQLRIRYTNPSVTKLLGFSQEEILGKELSTLLVNPDDLQFFKEQKEWKNQIFQWRNKDNAIRELESSAISFISKNHTSVLSFRGASRDVTERINFEKLKDEFISIISHELRSPLTSIMGALDLLEKEVAQTEQCKELFSIAIRNAHLLMELINNVLTIEKLHAGKLSIEVEPVSIKELVEHAVKNNQIFAGKGQIELCNEVQDDVKVNGNFTRLSEVLNNYLSNAIKFSPPNTKIHVSMQLENQRVRVSVRDEGKGISDDFKEKIFQKFSQKDASIQRSYQGTGLGLFICKEIIERLGGTVGFTSEEEKGSTFYFELPILT